MSKQNISRLVTLIADKARKAALELQNAPLERTNSALLRMAKHLSVARPSLQAANMKDLRAARLKNIAPAMLDRMTLSDKTIASMIRGVLEVAGLRSPLGLEYERRRRPNGLDICKVHVPLGVIAIIYESRPNVTVDAASICLKSGNAVILRGGSEAFHSNMAIAAILREEMKKAGIPVAALAVIPFTER